jgi:glutaminase
MTADHPGGHLYIVARGRFSISLAFQPGRSPLRRARMATFTAGMMFGDVAFLTGQRPMADVVAETAGEAWQLDRGDFEQLQQSNPRAAIALLMLLGMDLGRKLALCSQQLTMVEQL